MTSEKLGGIVLRLGIAFAFIYAALSAFAMPQGWIGYFPGFMRGIVPDSILIGSFGSVEIILALWILLGRRIFWPSLIAAAMLAGIVFFNASAFSFLFRDVSIALAALALALMNYRKR